MTIRIKSLLLVILSIIVLWFLYIERAILTPFIVAGIFAYLLNPLVNFLSTKLKLPRGISVGIIYLIIMGALSYAGYFIVKQIINEWGDLTRYTNNLIQLTRSQVYLLPDWAQYVVSDTLRSILKSNYFSGQEIVILFPKAFSKILSVVIFLFASFYFLKDGGAMFDRLLNLSPKKYRIEVEILFRRINAILGGYLRGQLLLILLVASALFIALTILGVRFSLILAIFSGFAEIVPLIGPIVATAVTVIVVLTTGAVNFGLQPLQGAIAVIVIYTVIRHIQDYFVTPVVMGKVTKLHPLIILFSVLAGQHLFGILGLITAVPSAAVIKLLIEYSLDKANEQERKTIKK